MDKLWNESGAEHDKEYIKMGNLTVEQLHHMSIVPDHYGIIKKIAAKASGSAQKVTSNNEGLHSKEEFEDEEVDCEELGVENTYTDFKSREVSSFHPHELSALEIAILSSVDLPDLTYKPRLPAQFLYLYSTPQLEAICYACQVHNNFLSNGDRVGFLLGDGPGMGQIHTIAGIIAENFILDRSRALWISTTNHIQYEIEKHFTNLNLKINVTNLDQFDFSDVYGKENGFFKYGLIYSTYTSLLVKSEHAPTRNKSRIYQLLHFLRSDFDGIIVFDECHNLNFSQSHQVCDAMIMLQRWLPKARVIYNSAIGVPQIRNMEFMVRLGLWGKHYSYAAFLSEMEQCGEIARKNVAINLKMQGLLLERQLSCEGIAVLVKEFPMSSGYSEIYQYSIDMWAAINIKLKRTFVKLNIDQRVQELIKRQYWFALERYFKNLCIAAKVNTVVEISRSALSMSKSVVIGLQSTDEFYMQEYLQEQQQKDGKLSGYVSTCELILQWFIEKVFPAPSRDLYEQRLKEGTSTNGTAPIVFYEVNPIDIELNNKELNWQVITDCKFDLQNYIINNVMKIISSKRRKDGQQSSQQSLQLDDLEYCINMRYNLLAKIKLLGTHLPPNSLDMLSSALGGCNNVAEITGRRGRVIRTNENEFQYELRCAGDVTIDEVNFQEQQSFQMETKSVAITTFTATKGIPLHSDRRASNPRCRLHIFMELPETIEEFAEHFGCTHRTKEATFPEYLICISNSVTERRAAAAAIRHLRSLRALDDEIIDPHDLPHLNLDNKLGKVALTKIMKELIDEQPAYRSSQVDKAKVKGELLAASKSAMVDIEFLAKRTCIGSEKKLDLLDILENNIDVCTFLNRIVGCPLDVQNWLLTNLQSKISDQIIQMSRSARFDIGVLDLNTHSPEVQIMQSKIFKRNHPFVTDDNAIIKVTTLLIERGLHYETALEIFNATERMEYEGFYSLQQETKKRTCAILCLTADSPRHYNNIEGKILLNIYRPNVGRQLRIESLESIKSRFVKISQEMAKDLWCQQYEMSVDKCSHFYWSSLCPFDGKCDVGLRVRVYHIISGLFNPIWPRIIKLYKVNKCNIRFVRVKTPENKTLLGVVVPQELYDKLISTLSLDSH